MARITEEQRKLLNSLCGDLSAQVRWHGRRLSKDSWRHLLSGTAKGWIMVPGIDRGEGNPGFIMLGGSSLTLTKDQATEAITMGFHIGDNPGEQGLDCPPVRWNDTICLARGINPNDQ